MQRLVQDPGYYSKYELQRLVHHSGIIEKRPGYYSMYGSGFRVLFKTRPAASGSGFSVLFKIRAAVSGSLFRVLLKNGQDIIHRMVPYSGYY